jgi:hypothetical protein
MSASSLGRRSFGRSGLPDIARSITAADAVLLGSSPASAILARVAALIFVDFASALARMQPVRRLLIAVMTPGSALPADSATFAARAAMAAPAAMAVASGLCMRASVARLPAPPPPTVKPARVRMLPSAEGSRSGRM